MKTYTVDSTVDPDWLLTLSKSKWTAFPWCGTFDMKMYIITVLHYHLLLFTLLSPQGRNLVDQTDWQNACHDTQDKKQHSSKLNLPRMPLLLTVSFPWTRALRSSGSWYSLWTNTPEENLNKSAEKHFYHYCARHEVDLYL